MSISYSLFSKYRFCPLIGISLASTLGIANTQDIQHHSIKAYCTLANTSSNNNAYGLLVTSNCDLATNTNLNVIAQENGDAYGIQVNDSQTLNINNADVTLKIKGGMDMSEKFKGSAYGIYKATNDTNGSKIEGSGNIHITEIMGTNAYIIKNDSQSGKITIGDTGSSRAKISLIIGQKIEKNAILYGIYSNLFEAKYDFGTGGLVYNIIGSNTENVVGIAIKQDTNLIGSLTLNADGGNVVGIAIQDSILQAQGASLSFTLGNTTASSTTLIKSSGTSAINSGMILVGNDGLGVKNNATKVIDNTGILTLEGEAKITIGSSSTKDAHINVASNQIANIALGDHSVTNFTGKAFGTNTGTIKLIVGNASQINFNSTLGDQEQINSVIGGGAIFNLAGTSGKIESRHSQNRGVKTLTIKELDTSSVHQFILYINTTQTPKKITFASDKIVIEKTTTNQSQQKSQNISIVFDQDKKEEILKITRDDSVLVATSQDGQTKFNTTTYIASGFHALKATLCDEKNQKSGEINYYITQVTDLGINPSDLAIISSSLMLNYDLYLANFNSLNKRMGELRDNAHSQGVWARIFNGQTRNDFGLGSQSNYTTIQAGYDYVFKTKDANNYLGLALSYGISLSEINSKAKDFTGQIRGIDDALIYDFEIALYNAYVRDIGWYNDSIAKFSYIANNFKIINHNLKLNEKLKLDNFALSISDEFGYRFKFGEKQEWFIDPQIEIGLGYFSKTNLNRILENSFMQTKTNPLFILRTRLGSSFAYDFKNFINQKNLSALLYVGMFYEFDYINAGNIFIQTNFDTHNINNELKPDGRVLLNIGTNIQADQNIRIYADFESSFAGKINTLYQINVGVRYNFGNVQHEPNLQTTQTYIPLKLKDLNQSL